MAVSAFNLTDEGKEDLFNEDFLVDDHYWVLVTATHTPSASADITLADISTNECADGDYARQDATGEAVSQTGGTVTIDIGDVDFGNTVTITAKYLYLVRGTVAGATGTDRLVGWYDLNDGGGSLSSTSGNFDITINASGLATAT